MDDLKKKQLLGLYKELGVEEVVDYASKNQYEEKIEKFSIKNDMKQNIQNKQNSTSRTIAESCDNILDLIKKIKEFDGCNLKQIANNTVAGDGCIDSEILLIGEAPGEQEDKYGVPFCGPSGELLSSMLSAIGLKRDKNFFVTNTIFWRPPANRKPTNEELAICLPFIEKIISIINPKVIIAVGSVAATNITGLNHNMQQFRNSDIAYINQYLTNPVKTFVIYHPAFLLRSPLNKKNAWFDLLNIEQFLKSTNIKL